LERFYKEMCLSVSYPSWTITHSRYYFFCSHN